MSRNHLIVAVLLAFVVAACAAPTEPVETSAVTQPPAVTEYPEPQQQVIQPTATSVYPGPDTGVEVGTLEPVQMIAPEYKPVEGDKNLKRDTVHLELEASEIVVMESLPVQVDVILRGSLPDPCHEMRIIPSEPDQENRIDLEVYSLVDASQTCITVIEPFEATISLGSFSTGTYTILVNGEVLGEFDA